MIIVCLQATRCAVTAQETCLVIKYQFSVTVAVQCTYCIKHILLSLVVLVVVVVCSAISWFLKISSLFPSLELLDLCINY